MKNASELKVFFDPKSVAIVGASSDPQKPGHMALKNLVSMGYKGKVYPINPREEEILGFRCYKNLMEIPDPVELCVLLISAELTMQVAVELVARKTRFHDITGAICMSAGFGELDSTEAKQREKELVRILRSASIRLIGPNCLGIIDAYSGFNTNFDIPAYPRGGMSIVTQSGAFANSFLFWAGGLRLVGLSKFASIGNMADVSMAELLTLLKDDDSTRVIGVYLEGLPDPRAFFQVAREVTAVKPIVVFKSGKSDAGSAAAMAHTGAIAGSDAIYEGAFKQAGLIRARSVPEFYDTLRAFEKQPLPDGNRVCVLTHMGGPGTICIDEISATPGIQMAEFSPETQSAIKSICAPIANVGRPDGYIDLTAAHYPKLHNQVLQLLFQDPNVDLVLQILAPSAFINQKLIAEEIAGAYQSQREKGKPLLNAVTFGQFALEARQGLENAGLPTVEYPDALPRIAGHMATYVAFRREAVAQALESPVMERANTAASPAAGLIAAATKQGRVNLLEPEAYEICRQYGIQVPQFGVADTPAIATDVANRIGYPVVLKVVSTEILHKTDVGGVILGIHSDETLDQAYRTIAENAKKAAPNIRQLKVLIQKMMPATTELVLGAIRDKLFGPVVMLGLRGIYVEAIKPVGFRLAPLDVQEAKNLVLGTLPPALIQGSRGRMPMNVDSIACAIVSLGQLLTEQPEIERADLNPLLTHGNSCVAVDARIILSKKN
jgi:acetyltransferase